MILGLRDTIKFGILVGLAAIFTDASIAHGLWWENDPYWTYWITKSFLIAVVYIIGTAILGIGILRGIIITVVHTLVLEIYYQWFAPIGLPQEPWWLEFRDLWIPGYFVHFLVIFSGYLIALWIWIRSRQMKVIENAISLPAVIYALILSVGVLVVDGLITQGLLLRNFPGWTFFLQHLLIAFVFLAVWTAFIGLDRRGAFAAALLLSLVWTTYSMYLGPIGLPNRPPSYLGYTDLWLKSFPGAFVSIFAALWILRVFMPISLRTGLKSLAVLLVGASLMLPNSILASEHNPVGGGMTAAARASGTGSMIVGSDPYNLNSAQSMNGSINISVNDIGNRWSPVQNKDIIQVEANFSTNGSNYRIVIDKPMPRHPLGNYATWMGVAYNHSMHGDTGIGTNKVEKVKPEIAVWGFATVERNGEVIAKMAPAHVMVMSKEPLKGITLEVSAEDKDLVGAPEGYLHVMWPNIDSLEMPENERRKREVIGWLALIAINGAFLWLIKREPLDVSRESRA